MKVFILSGGRSIHRNQLWETAIGKENVTGWHNEYQANGVWQKIIRRGRWYRDIHRSDAVLLCDGCVIWDVLLVAKLMRKKILCDYFVSDYDMIVLDRKTIPDHTWRSLKFKINDWLRLFLSTHLIFLNQAERRYYLHVAGLPENFREKDTSILPISWYCMGKAKLPYWNGQKKTANLAYMGGYVPLHGLDKIIRSIAILKQGGGTGPFLDLGELRERVPAV